MEISRIIHPNESGLFREFLFDLHQMDTKHLLRNDIVLHFKEFCERRSSDKVDLEKQNSLTTFFSKTQEILLDDDYSVIFFREKVTRYHFYGIRGEDDVLDVLTPEEFLDIREKVTGVSNVSPEKKLLIDFEPFYSTGPKIRDPKKIGFGQRLLTNFMAGKLHDQSENWSQFLCNFLKIHSINGEQVLVDGSMVQDSDQLYDALQSAIQYLENITRNTSKKAIDNHLKTLGFYRGFGNNAGRILETMRLLADLLEEPKADILEAFIARIPMISKVAIISPHGWFGQENVLGRPDTGGQIVYILDQVRALEKYLAENLKSAGVKVTPKIIVLTRLIPNNDGTRSNERREKIHGTENSWILRVPFRDSEMNVIQDWISRFHIWSYLEQYALDCKSELLAELGGKPDMIVGNYSDGNLVASLLSSWLQVIQCNIAHALEKSKYLFSDLYWRDLENDYKFSLQFTADLLSMNRADIVIASTYQEIAGTDTVLGQYESYYLFSMPDLFKVSRGINLFHPKFNVVSPGVNENVYFPFNASEHRIQNRIEELEDLLFTGEGENTYGQLDEPDKPPIFTMARLDKIKNITGLVQGYGLNKELQEKANLIVIAGSIHESQTSEGEERQELSRMYQLIDKFNLHGKIRWLGIRVSKAESGEIYRIIADRKGVFVQPALFEAFGLTVLEAMATGLPTFATQFGGPLEIIQNGKNGYLINPTHTELMTGPILQFFNSLEKQPEMWDKISKQAITRVRSSYTWKLYSEKMIKSAKLYGFWNYSGEANEKKEIDHYCDLIFHLIYKARAMQSR